MIVNFFDRNFRPLTDNASLSVENYTLVKSAVDIDEFTCVCEPHDIDINPFFVTLEDDKGRYVYGAMAGLPERQKENNKTKITAADLKTLFKGEVVLDFTRSTYMFLQSYIEKLFEVFAAQLMQGYLPAGYHISYDLTGLNDKELNMIVVKTDAAYKADLWAVLSEILLYSDCYMESRIQLYDTQEVNRNGVLVTIPKGIHFRVASNQLRTKAIVLTDYNIEDFSKTVAPLNEAVVYNKDLTEIRKTWYLLSDNTLTQNKALRDLFPIKRKIFAAKESAQTDINNAEAEAILALAENKYQENISIPFNAKINPQDFYFDTFLDIYPRPTFDEDGERTNKYKSLPVGAIGITESRSGSSYWLEIGYRSNNAVWALRKLLGAK